jgi:UDP-2,4-diacetamido-2,4,6-trideoxy-beta-L-altropyranose hydrolase
MRAIFRTNAGPHVGFGHLSRCRSLAIALRREDKRCIMVGPNQVYAKSEDRDVFDDWVPLHGCPSSQEDAKRVISLAQQHQASWLVLDDYRVDEDYQLAVRAAGLRWLQFDRNASKPLWADVIVNANPAAKAEDYAKVLRNPHARLLLGPSYAILRPQFEQVMPRETGRPIKKILVTFGGGDDRGLNQFVLSTLLPAAKLDQEFVVISGANNPNNHSLREWIDTYGEGRITLYIDLTDVAQIMASCDLAVMAGGTSTYEAVRCGLPMLIIAIAKDQISGALGWQKLGLAVYLGQMNHISEEKLLRNYNALTQKISKHNSSNKYVVDIVDGLGSTRVSKIVMSETMQ